MCYLAALWGKKKGGEGNRDAQRKKPPVCVPMLVQPQDQSYVCDSAHPEVLRFWSLLELLLDILSCLLDLWHSQSASSLSIAPQSKLCNQHLCLNREFWPKQGRPVSWGFPPPTISSAVSLLSWQWFYLVTVWDNARHTADKGFFVGLLLWVSQVASHCADSVGQEGWQSETDWGSICVWGGKLEADVFVMSW